MQIGGRILLGHIADVAPRIGVRCAAQFEQTRSAVDVEQVRKGVEVRRDPVRHRPARRPQIASEAADQLGQVGQGHTGRQLGHHALVDARQSPGIELVFLVVHPGLQRQRRRQVKASIELRCLDGVRHPLRTQPDFRTRGSEIIGQRVGDIVAEADQRRVAVLPIVVEVVVRILAIQDHRRLDRIVEVGLGIADQTLDAESVAELMLDAQRALGVFGVQLVVAGLGLHIDVVEQAIDHVPVRIDDAVAHDDFRPSALGRVTGEGQGLQPVLLTRRLEIGIEQIEVDQRLFLRAELH